MHCPALFVTGTDTDIGKTTVTTWLLRQLCAGGKRALGMKPIAVGGEKSGGAWRYADVEALRDAGYRPVDRRLLNPYHFPEAVSPHIAAASANAMVDPAQVHAALDALRTQADVVLVEGAGGWRSPLGETLDNGQLCKQLHLPVLLVVGMRLGCLNHALLTADAIKAEGIPLAGWVANCITRDMPRLHDNLATLKSRLDAPMLALLPYSKTGHEEPVVDWSALWRTVQTHANG